MKVVAKSLAKATPQDLRAFAPLPAKDPPAPGDKGKSQTVTSSESDENTMVIR
jgi:hypothetical protein